MAFVLVQYYTYGPLPTIFENSMGDVPASSSSPAEQAGQIRQDLDSTSSQYPQTQSSNPQQQRVNPNQQPTMAQQQAMASFHMASIGAALPNPPYAQPFPQHSQQQFPLSVPAPAAYHLGQTPQFGGQQAMNQSSNSAFSMQYQQYQPLYPPPHIPHQAIQQSSPQNQQYYANPPFLAQHASPQVPPYYFPPGQYVQQPGQGYQVAPQHYDRSGASHHVVHGARRSSEHLSIATSASPANRSSNSGWSLNSTK